MQRVNVPRRASPARKRRSTLVSRFFVVRTNDFHFESVFSFYNSSGSALLFRRASRIVAVLLDFARPLFHRNTSRLLKKIDERSFVGDARLAILLLSRTNYARETHFLGPSLFIKEKTPLCVRTRTGLNF